MPNDNNNLIHIHINPSSNPDESHQVVSLPGPISIESFKSMDNVLRDISTITECDPITYLTFRRAPTLSDPKDMLMPRKHYIARFNEREEEDAQNQSSSSSSSMKQNNNSNDTSINNSNKRVGFAAGTTGGGVTFNTMATVREYSISFVRNSQSLSQSPSHHHQHQQQHHSNLAATDLRQVSAGRSAAAGGLNLFHNNNHNNQQHHQQLTFPIPYEHNGSQYFIQNQKEVDRLIHHRSGNEENQNDNHDDDEHYVTGKTKRQLDDDFERLIGIQNDNLPPRQSTYLP